MSDYFALQSMMSGGKGTVPAQFLMHPLTDEIRNAVIGVQRIERWAQFSKPLRDSTRWIESSFLRKSSTIRARHCRYELLSSRHFPVQYYAVARR